MPKLSSSPPPIFYQQTLKRNPDQQEETKFIAYHKLQDFFSGSFSHSILSSRFPQFKVFCSIFIGHYHFGYKPSTNHEELLLRNNNQITKAAVGTNLSLSFIDPKHQKVLHSYFQIGKVQKRPLFGNWHFINRDLKMSNVSFSISLLLPQKNLQINLSLFALVLKGAYKMTCTQVGGDFRLPKIGVKTSYKMFTNMLLYTSNNVKA